MNNTDLQLEILAELRKLNAHLERIESDIRGVKLNPSNPLLRLFLKG